MKLHINGFFICRNKKTEYIRDLIIIICARLMIDKLQILILSLKHYLNHFILLFKVLFK